MTSREREDALFLNVHSEIFWGEEEEEEGGGGGGRGRHGGGATASMLAVGCSSSVVMYRLRGSGLRADW